MTQETTKTFRMDLGLAERLREQAKQTGQTDSEVTREALDFYLTFEPEVFAWLAALAERLRLPLGLVAEGIIVRRMAEIEAYREVHGHDDPSPLVEFAMTSKGLIRGPERFQLLKEHLTGQLGELAEEQAAQPRQAREEAELTEGEKAMIAEARELHHKKTGRKLKR